MPEEQVVHVDPFRPLGEKPGTGHNRWHEAIAPVVKVDPGDTVIYETCDAFDCQLNWGSTEEDVARLPEPGAPVDRVRIREGCGVRSPLRGRDCRDRGRPLGAVGLYQ